MDVKFELEGERCRRVAFRERVRGLTARLEDGEEFVVHDISAAGLALVDGAGLLAVDRRCRLTLAIGPRKLVSGLPATVVRAAAGQGMAGLAFGELTLRQEAWLDKMVLEIQKRRIDLRKAAREPDENIEGKKTDRVDE